MYMVNVFSDVAILVVCPQIEKHVVHVLEGEASRAPGSDSRLSAEELEYAKEYADNMDSHLTALVLKNMPSNFQRLDRKKAGWCM